MKGHGSLGAYSKAITDARKAGEDVYPARHDAKVDRWRKMRNAAAHTPASSESRPRLDASAAEVRAELAGIEAFIEQTR